MKNLITIFILSLCLMACETEQRGNIDEEEAPDTNLVDRADQDSDAGELDTANWQTFSSRNWSIKLPYPPEWMTVESNPGQQLVAVNVYHSPEGATVDPPLNVHEDAKVSHISFFPKGWGTEMPWGERKTLAQWNKSLPLNFAVNEEESHVFMLSDGTPWAFLIRPRQMPESWEQEGYLFAQIAIDNYRSKCYDDETGRELGARECDPMMGDSIANYGTVDQRSRKQIMHMLQTLRFVSPDRMERPLGDLIRLEKPQPNADISSPVTIKGEARGMWYFEASFPVELLDKDYNTIAQGVAQAQGEWMTEDWVPFELTLEYDSPGDERGYIALHRSNASGLPEHDRVSRVPVIFK